MNTEKKGVTSFVHFSPFLLSIFPKFALGILVTNTSNESLDCSLSGDIVSITK